MSQGEVSVKTAQGVPPHEAGVTTVLVLVLKPSTHSDQAPHSDTTQLIGKQQALVSSNSGQGAPPHSAGLTIVLVLV
jgi:hypothetical protein